MLIILFISGLLLGLSGGYVGYRSYLLKENRFSLLVKFPANNFFILNNFLHSDNVLKRTLSYYGLTELQLLDLEFLEERVAEDNLVFEKKAVLWSIAQGGDRVAVLNSLQRIFKSADTQTRFFIINQVKALDINLYKQLLQQLAPEVRRKYKKKMNKKQVNIKYQA
jgi:hypothetical protein